MRTLSIFLLTSLIFLPYLVGAESLVPCDEVKRQCQACDFITLATRIIKFLISIMAMLCAIVVAVAGFKIVTSGGEAGAITEARAMITNVVIGFVILLTAWLIVDTVIKLFIGGNYGPWNNIDCVIQPTGLAGTPGGSVTGGGTAYTGKVTQCAPGNTACSSAALQQAGFTQTQANVMSCIAMTESSGNPSVPPYNIAHPTSKSTACGTFQITKTTWSKNAKGSCSDFSNCTNASCNTQVAQTLVSKNGYRDWTCPNCNSKAQACIDTYGK
jgi:hypothetical protein